MARKKSILSGNFRGKTKVESFALLWVWGGRPLDDTVMAAGNFLSVLVSVTVFFQEWMQWCDYIEGSREVAEGDRCV